MKRIAALCALTIVAACSGLGSQVAPSAVGAGATSGLRATGHAHSKGLVFVSDLDNDTVWICPVTTIEDGYAPSTGQLQGVQNPAQLAVDSKGTIYVANAQVDASGAGEITEYPRGSTSPSTTLKTGLNTSTGVAVDSAGNVYVSNKYLANVVMFPKGKSAPTKTFSGPLNGPDGLAVDKAGDLYIADSSANEVFEVAHGSTTPRSLGLAGLNRPMGVALDSKGDLYVSNMLGASSTLNVYTAASTKPKDTIVVPGPMYGSESTIAETAMVSVSNPGDVVIVSAPISLALVSSEEYFGYYSTVVAYQAGSTTPAWSNGQTTGYDTVFQPEK